MPIDDTTWVIHSLPRARAYVPRPARTAPQHAFRSVLSPWRERKGSLDRLQPRPQGGGPRRSVRVAG